MPLRDIFSAKNACVLLIHVQEGLAEKYNLYRTYLNHNYTALTLMADMEQMYYSGRPFTLDTVQIKYEAFFEALTGAIFSLDKISPGKYAPLLEAANRIDQQVSSHFVPRFCSLCNEIVLPFGTSLPEMKHVVGSKAANLFTIADQLKLPVPPGFAITAYAFRRFLDETGLGIAIERKLAAATSDEEIRIAGDAIRAMINGADVPSAIATEIMTHYERLERAHGKSLKTAVRSSAIREDSEASFAGQYETVLNVTGENVITAYKEVVASKYSLRALKYRVNLGISDQETPMAVLVLAMVEPKASGVVYTAGTSRGETLMMTISSLWGLGEHLVSGSASADTFTINRETLEIAERAIRPKTTKMVNLPGGGISVVDVADDQALLPSLSDDAIVQLARYAMKLEGHFGEPQDIEWALDERDNLFMLQSRPLNLKDVPGHSGEQETDPPDIPILFSGGTTASSGAAAGAVFILKNKDDIGRIPEKAVVIARTASPDLAGVMDRISGLITDVGSPTSHLASVAREFGIPMIVDAGRATSSLHTGQTVTMSADAARVYEGVAEELLKRARPARKTIIESPVHRKMRSILDALSPLNLSDPEDPSFSPEGCRTAHDIIRFTHENAVKDIFGLADSLDGGGKSVKLTSNIPLPLYLVDLGGGLRPGLTTCNEVTPDHIESVPMRAVWKGFTHPGITWSGGLALDKSKFLSLMAATATSEIGAGAPGGESYGLISADYMNLSAKFGYHFATVDALCGVNSDQNYVSLQFAGGAGSYYGKSMRVRFIGEVLQRLGFQVSLKGDLLDAIISRYDAGTLEGILDQLGRLLASTRLLDMSIPSQDEASAYAERFFRGEYDFLSQPAPDRLTGFYTREGHWTRATRDGRPCILQDGSKAGFVLTSGLAGVMGKVVGKKLQDFFDTIEAYYYFPLAVARDGEMSEGRVSAAVKPLSGNIDQAGGLVFAMRSTGDYFTFRINAREDNAILFEFVNGKRIERARVVRPVRRDTWYRLSVAVEGNAATCFLNDEEIIRYTAERPLVGFTGLWTKADSVTLFDRFTIETGKGRKAIES